MRLQKKRSCAEAVYEMSAFTPQAFPSEMAKYCSQNLSEYLLVCSLSDWQRQADEKSFQVEAERVLNDSQTWHRLSLCIISKVSRAARFLQSSNTQSVFLFQLLITTAVDLRVCSSSSQAPIN